VAIIQRDSKLLSGWPIIIKPKANKTKLLVEYVSVTQRVLFGYAILAAMMTGRNYDVISQNGDCSRESNVRTFFSSKQSSLSKRNIVTELNMYKGIIPTNL
jgi:hypothetical protein